MDSKFNYIYPVYKTGNYLAINDNNNICTIDNELNLKILETPKVKSVIPRKGENTVYIGINMDNYLYSIDDIEYTQKNIQLSYITENPNSTKTSDTYIGIDMNNKLCVIDENLEIKGEFTADLMKAEPLNPPLNHNYYEDFKFKKILKFNNKDEFYGFGTDGFGTDGNSYILGNFSNILSLSSFPGPLVKDLIQIKDNSFLAILQDNTLLRIEDDLTIKDQKLITKIKFNSIVPFYTS